MKRRDYIVTRIGDTPHPEVVMRRHDLSGMTFAVAWIGAAALAACSGAGQAASGTAGASSGQGGTGQSAANTTGTATGATTTGSGGANTAEVKVAFIGDSGNGTSFQSVLD